MVLLLFATFWIGQLTRLIYDIPEMMDMCNFYTYLLQIPDVNTRSSINLAIDLQRTDIDWTAFFR